MLNLKLGVGLWVQSIGQQSVHNTNIKNTKPYMHAYNVSTIEC